MQLVVLLDSLIKKVIGAVKIILPPEEQENIRKRTYSSSGLAINFVLVAAQYAPDADLLGAEITVLYKHLLTIPPDQVDEIISKAFKR